MEVNSVREMKAALRWGEKKRREEEGGKSESTADQQHLPVDTGTTAIESLLITRESLLITRESLLITGETRLFADWLVKVQRKPTQPKLHPDVEGKFPNYLQYVKSANEGEKISFSYFYFFFMLEILGLTSWPKT